MSLFSGKFVVFVLATMVVYFLVPKKAQWIVLLVASYVFYLSASIRLSAFMIITTLSTYGAGLWMSSITNTTNATVKEHKEDWDRAQKRAYKDQQASKRYRLLALTMVLNFGILAFIKYFDVAVIQINDWFQADWTPGIRVLMPLGISFYTFQSMGYLIDVCRENTEAQRNVARFALFVAFFPQIIQGPISVYSQLAHQLYESHELEFVRVKYGLELILWGLFKKLVIADRALIAIQAYLADTSSFNGTVAVFVVLVYALQLYADFSAGIDICRGIAQMLGIDMIENFRRPYFSVSIADYWRRWHISLGAWMRNYVFYPVALCGLSVKFMKAVGKSRFGQSKMGAHIAKTGPSAVASLIIFLIIGVWHGAGWKYFMYGVWNGVIVMVSVLLEPVYGMINKALHINVKGFGMRVFRIFRTFVLVYIGYIMDMAVDFGDSLRMMAHMVVDQNIPQAIQQIVDGLGLLASDYFVLLVSGLVLFVVSLVQETHEETGGLRKLLDTKPLIWRWGLIFLCVISIVIFGVYGPGFNPADFVYMQF